MRSIQSAPSSTRLRWRAGRFATLVVIAVAAVTLLPSTYAGAAQAPVPLGVAGSFAVLAGSGITNTGPTTITGDTGTFPTPSETGFGSVTQSGANHIGDAVTQQAKTNLTTAYNTAAGSGPAAAEPVELGGLTLTPGVYTGPAGGLAITGTLTLNTLGDPAAVFIFKTSSTLITAGSSNVAVLNGGLACNVFWQVASSATLGVSSHLIGTVLAATSITATTGATVIGRLLAENGAVTLDSNTITNQGCPPVVPTTTTAAPTTTKAPTATTAAPKATAGPVLPAGLTRTGTPGAPTGGPGAPTGAPGRTTGTAGTPTPALPFTGNNVRWPILVGGLAVVVGVSLLGLSTVGDRRLKA
jgi:hypothetical protein